MRAHWPLAVRVLQRTASRARRQRQLRGHHRRPASICRMCGSLCARHAGGAQDASRPARRSGDG
eukprot:6688040-Prymnesium_polylepis.1